MKEQMSAAKIDPASDFGAHAQEPSREAATEESAVSVATARRKRVSMHDGIAVWCDCCSCEAEPRWVAVAEELGIELGDDYEDPGCGTV